MTRYLALALLPVLAACSPAPPANTVQARCQQQADNNPTVQALLLEQPARPGNPALQRQIDQARHRAVNECLVAAGAPVRGGVEPVARAHYGFGWF
jgi:hypothetical protein